MRRTDAARLLALIALAAGVAGCGDREQTSKAIEVPAGLAPAERDAYSKPLGAAVEVEFAREDEDYRRALIETFTSVTPENALKWALVEPERGRFEFGEMDSLATFARRTGKRLRGHPLVWDEQLPEWIAKGDWTKAELARVLRRHVKALVGRYRGRVAEWDVVNEPFEDDGSLTENIFQRVIGPAWIGMAFRAAHEADPSARLFLNEINAEPPSPKGTALRKLAAFLKREGVPIDGVGLQNHRVPESFPDARTLGAEFARYRALGLDVAITEMDVNTSGDNSEPAYEQAARACAAAANCTGLTVWGVTDDHSWLGANKRPLLFDGDGKPKPALAAARKALARG